MIITVKVKPGSKQGDKLERLDDGAFVVFLRARAHDGKANTANDKETYLSVCHSLGYEWGDVPASDMQCFLYNLFYEFHMTPKKFRAAYP